MEFRVLGLSVGLKGSEFKGRAERFKRKGLGLGVQGGAVQGFTDGIQASVLKVFECP